MFYFPYINTYTQYPPIFKMLVKPVMPKSSNCLSNLDLMLHATYYYSHINILLQSQTIQITFEY